jgi:outer membrane protein assembly factor BamE (lipoprotein component of BamABCDE complex)
MKWAMKTGVLILVAVSLLWLTACASGGGSDAGSTSGTKAEKPEYSNAPPGSELAKIQLGMDDTEVRAILGAPSDTSSYMTGKGFIPFYYGPDTHRSDWIYKGKGRVVFSRNRWSGALKVIRVLSNPNEM